LKIEYLNKGTLFLAETFKIFSGPSGLSVGKSSGRNSFIGFFWCFIVIGRKSSKMDITFESSNRNPNPFRAFTRALYSIYRHKLNEIGGGHLRRFPRQKDLTSNQINKRHCSKDASKEKELENHFICFSLLTVWVRKQRV
jgi:hypothetical protein